MNKWLGLLDQLTVFSNPAWTDADGNAAALSIPLVLVAAFVGEHQDRPWLALFLRRALLGATAAAVVCFILRLFLASPRFLPWLHLASDDAIGLVWELLYILLIALIALAITFAFLFRSAPP